MGGAGRGGRRARRRGCARGARKPSSGHGQRATRLSHTRRTQPKLGAHCRVSIPHLLARCHQPICAIRQRLISSPADDALSARAQLAALMELGIHAEQALPCCDGRSSIEVLVEALALEAQQEGRGGAGAGSGAGGATRERSRAGPKSIEPHAQAPGEARVAGPLLRGTTPKKRSFFRSRA